jgi:beta-alanine--pyruvate transaminase
MGQTNLEPYWLPFTPNRYFKRHPKMVVSAKGAYYQTDDGRQLFDCLSGMWCCPLGHSHPKIVEAFKRQVATLDYAPAFQIGNDATFKLAERIADMAPAGLDRVFFVNSGSESVDTALKIALGYHRVRGEGGRFRMIGRERAYHGVGFGGISVGGMVANRKAFATLMLPGVDHLPHTWNPAQMAFSQGQPNWGLHLADDLERLIALHDASTIAAVIVEPVQGSTGVLVPPLGYLQRLREICTKHGILLIFDEVITGFGRLGSNFAAQRFDVVPDMITFAKGVTNGTIPLGGVIARRDIYETFMAATAPEHVPELFHGYTYSGHSMATAVGLATVDALVDEGLMQRAAELEPVLQNAVHSLKGEPGVLDIRNFGLMAAVDVEPIPGKPGLRAFRVFEQGFANAHLFRVTGDTIAMGPPFISTPSELEHMIDGLRAAIRASFKD